jgi:hypothetical protein
MRKFNRKEKERIRGLNELVTDAVALYNEGVEQLMLYHRQVAELLFYIELHAAFPIHEREARDYSSLYSELKRIDSRMERVQAEAHRLETEFTQLNRQYDRLIHHLENAGEKGASKIFAQMEELALDLDIHSYNIKAGIDLHYGLFCDYRFKLMAILFN